MKDIGGGSFEKTIIPEAFFNLQDGQKIDQLIGVVLRKSTYNRVTKDLKIDMSCWN